MGKHSAGRRRSEAARRRVSPSCSDAVTSKSAFGARHAFQDPAAAERPAGRGTTDSKRGPRDAMLSPELQKQRAQRRQLRKRILVAVAVSVGALFVAAVAWAMWFTAAVNKDMRASAPVHKKILQALSKPKPQEPFTILLMGADARGGDTSWHSDTIILAKVDPEQKRVWMLSIPRDTRVEIPGYSGHYKINRASAMGGAPLAIKTVEQFTGVPINHYAQMDFSGFRSVVNQLGGVWIDVDVEIDDPKAARQNPGGKGRHIEPGYQLLDGYHALTYVRSRDFPDGDFTRMRHQQTFFQAVARQASQPGNMLKIPSIVRSVAKHTTTDLTVGQMLAIANSLRGISPEALETATVLGEWRSPYVWPDEAEKARLIAAMKAGRSFDDTSTVALSDPAGVTVSVRNGAGIPGVATQAKQLLEQQGYTIAEVGNARRSDYDQTTVVYQTNEAAAQRIASLLPVARVVPSNGEYAYDTEILVVVGRDWR